MIPVHTMLAAAIVGVVVGFLGGLLGKGGSAIATPLLHAIGVPAIIAVATPLPATIPSTIAASWVYWKEQYIDSRVVRSCVWWGVPATILGALATNWISGGLLVQVTDALLVALGIRLLLHRAESAPTGRRAQPTDPDTRPDGDAADAEALGAANPLTTHRPLAARASLVGLDGLATTADAAPPAAIPTTPAAATTDARPVLLAAIAIAVGFSAGLLANSGGFLLAPLMITVVRLPIRSALASSLAVSAVLAIPGTVVHAALGHIDWTLVAVLAAAAMPLSMAGARVALRVDAHRLERTYGAMLVLLGGIFLLA